MDAPKHNEENVRKVIDERLAGRFNWKPTPMKYRAGPWWAHSDVHVTLMFKPKIDYFDSGFLERISLLGSSPDSSILEESILRRHSWVDEKDSGLARCETSFVKNARELGEMGIVWYGPSHQTHINFGLEPAHLKKQFQKEMKSYGFPIIDRPVNEGNRIDDLQTEGLIFVSSERQVKNGTHVWFDPITSYSITFYTDKSRKETPVKSVTAINFISSHSQQSNIVKDVSYRDARTKALTYLKKKRANVVHPKVEAVPVGSMVVVMPTMYKGATRVDKHVTEAVEAVKELDAALRQRARYPETLQVIELIQAFSRPPIEFLKAADMVVPTTIPVSEHHDYAVLIPNNESGREILNLLSIELSRTKSGHAYWARNTFRYVVNSPIGFPHFAAKKPPGIDVPRWFVDRLL